MYYIILHPSWSTIETHQHLEAVEQFLVPGREPKIPGIKPKIPKIPEETHKDTRKTCKSVTWAQYWTGDPEGDLCFEVKVAGNPYKYLVILLNSTGLFISTMHINNN